VRIRCSIGGQVFSTGGANKFLRKRLVVDLSSLMHSRNFALKEVSVKSQWRTHQCNKTDQLAAHFRRPAASWMSLCGISQHFAPRAGHPPARGLRESSSRTQSPTFDRLFGNVGQYSSWDRRSARSTRAIIGMRRSVISVSRRAMPAAWSVFNGYLHLRPVDPRKGNRRILFEINNRGSKLALAGSFGNSTTAPAAEASDHRG
jgi:hypothetical protein